MQNNTSKIEIYIGAPIEYSSERVAFQHIHSLIQKANVNAIIIANANINNVQIDLIVAFEKTAYVIEVKGSRSPIRGGVNGIWEKKSLTGSWSTLKNYYLQALTASYKTKDALTLLLGKEISYLKSMLLFVPGLHAESVIPESDFKVNRQSLNTFTSFDLTDKNGCTLDEWRRFCTHTHLQKLSISDASYDKVLWEAEQLLDKYNTSFINDYGKDIKTLVPVDCTFEGSTTSSDSIYENIVSSDSNILITGESGCAKTLIAKEIGVKFAKAKNIPVYIEAKYFEKLLGPLLEEEIKLLGMPAAVTLFSLSKKLEKESLLIIDGFNECSPVLQERLARCILALCNRYDVKILLVTQYPGNSIVKLSLKNIAVSPPNVEVKKRIALSFCLPESMKELEQIMSAITSGMEARIVGEIGSNSLDKISRFSLFEFFARTKLDTHAPEGIKALSYIGNYLSEKISYNLSVREFDRVIESHGINPGIKNILLSSNLIKEKFDKICFSHELFMNTFIAESIVRSSGLKKEQILDALKAPKNYDKNDLILGAVENIEILQSLLEEISSPDLIISLYFGAAGKYSANWVNKRFSEIIVKIKREVENIVFKIVNDSFRRVAVQEDSLGQWSAQDYGFVTALPELLVRDIYTKEFFDIIPIMDERMERYYIQLAPEAKEKKIPLNSELFAAAYVTFSHECCALSRIISELHSGFIVLKMRSTQTEGVVTRLLNKSTITNGQMYFILSLNRFKDGSKHLFPIFLEFLTSKWRYLPYHLKLKLLDTVKYYHDFEEEREQLIDALNPLMSESHIFISSSAFEAYQSLGATEDDEIAYESTARNELEKLLLNVEDPELWESAFGFYSCQFDHPYSGAYSTVIYALENDKKQQFYSMVVRGAKDGLFTVSAILELAQIAGDQSCIYLEKWRNAPPEKSSMPQDVTQIFFLTHFLLGRFSYPITSLLGTYETIRDNTLCACGEIFYWINRNDIDIESRKERCDPLWEYLLQSNMALAIEGIWLAGYSLKDYYLHNYKEPPPAIIGNVFPTKTAEVARRAIQAPDFQNGIFQWDKEQTVILHAISILNSHGSVIDIPVLKNLIDDNVYGRNAVDAIRTLQEDL